MRPGLSIIHEDIREVATELGDAVYRLAGKHLLLTGASGYLASYLADAIVWLNDHVLSSPCHLFALTRNQLTIGSRLDHLKERTDVTFIAQPVERSIELPIPVEFVIHAASKASPRQYLDAPFDTMAANVRATWNLLENASTWRCESFMFFSSGEIYGDPQPEFIPTPESYRGNVDCTADRSVYTESKRFGETLCMAYWRNHGTPVKIIRPFHLYGPGLRLDDGRVLADFLRCRLLRQPIKMLSPGRDQRAFCYLSDGLLMFLRVLLSDHNGEAFNVGNDNEPVMIRELAEIIATLEEPRLDLNIAADTPMHLKNTPGRACPDITKIRSLLNCHPRVSLAEGLRRTLAWQREVFAEAISK